MNALWTEKYRPKSIDDLNAPEHIKRFLRRAVSEGHPHLLLYGPPGTGKTTISGLLSPTLVLNASDERGINVIRNTIKQRASTVSKQVIVLDECENLTRDAQTCLRRVLEDFPNTVFIFCTNYASGIIRPLRSRTLALKITPCRGHALPRIGELEGLPFAGTTYDALFEKCNGDLRRCINVLQGLRPLYKNSSDTDVTAALDSSIGIVPDSKISELKSVTVLNYRDFVADFIRSSFSVLQLIQQLNRCLEGTERQKCAFFLSLSRLEGCSTAGCSDEIVLMNLCADKIEIYNK